MGAGDGLILIIGSHDDMHDRKTCRFFVDDDGCCVLKSEFMIRFYYHTVY